MSLLSRRELLRSITQRYRAASRKDKQRILDEFVETTGYHLDDEHAGQRFDAFDRLTEKFLPLFFTVSQQSLIERREQCPFNFKSGIDRL